MGQLQAFALQSVTLAWDASNDATVTGYFVYYGGTSGNYTNKLDAGNATSLSVPNLSEGATYYFAVTAYDDVGLESLPSNEVSYSVPMVPAATLTAPANGSSYLAPATINFSASVVTNGHTVTQVQFFNGATPLTTLTQSPYTFAWSGVAAGSYTVFARVTYDAGSTSDSPSATVTVTNLAPAIALTAPTTGTTFLAPATVNLAANVTTNSHTITQVQFYNGTTLLATDTQPPYTFAWNNVSAGSYSVKARVTYDSGSTLDSTAASITVTNPLPTIVLTAPAAGTTFAGPATVNLAASVTANGHTISQVQFYSGTMALGTDATAPYSLTWAGVGAGSYTVKARLVFDSGSTLDSATVSFSVTNAPPTVALTSPTNGAVFPAPGNIKCTASVTSSGHSITKVQFYNGATWLGEATSSPYSIVWNCTNSGNYSLFAHLIYDSGSTADSATANIQVQPASPTNPHVITVDGNGTVTPDLTAQPLVMGNRYTVTAVPASGQQFVGWTGSVTSTNTTISFLMTPSANLQAKFIPFPNGGVAANYYGLYYESNQVQQSSSGAFVLTTTARGLYSGYLQTGKTRLPFRGQLDPQGHGTNTLLRADHTPLSLQFNLINGTPGDQVQGSVSADNWVADLAGDRSVFSPKTNPAPLAGAYTMVLPGPEASDPALPFGHSFGLVNIDTAGHVRLSASLADGTRVTQSAPLSARGLWGLYAPLYAGQGSLVSWLSFTNRSSDDFNGALSWIKPADSRSRYYPGGFTNDCLAAGSAFTPTPSTNTLALSGPNATVSFAGGNLSAAFSNTLVQSATGRLQNQSANRLSLGVARTTGAFRGSVTDPSSGKSLPFTGVLFQKTQSGYGFLLDLGQSSQVNLAQ